VKLVADLETLWSDMLSEVDNKLNNKKSAVDAKLVKHYEAAYACKSGCTCENIMTEYDQVIKW
jgi:hypothetical protein